MAFLFRFSSRIGRRQWNMVQFLIFGFTLLLTTAIEVKGGAVHHRIPENDMLILFAFNMWINIRHFGSAAA